MIRRWLPYPLLSAALFAGWLMLTGDLSAGHLLLAAVLGAAIPRISAPFLDHLPRVRSPSAALRLLLLVTWDIVMANVAVSRLVLGPTGRLSPVFLHVPLALSNPQSTALFASIITMTPGTVSAVIDTENRELLVHALDCQDPDALIAGIKERYEKPLLEIFGC
jgi:multicomponent K+:H+ antiporter subunit E